ncbi:hypothetical protein BGX38DRAFT_1161469 [Terfezia claveryi]|nr:hypothetical protein BGX38DRAFT_1161469 [Terfezia claveryi]
MLFILIAHLQSYCSFVISFSDIWYLISCVFRAFQFFTTPNLSSVFFVSSSIILTMVNPKPKPGAASEKPGISPLAIRTSVPRAHQPTRSSRSKISKSEAESTTEPETPASKAAAARKTRTPTAASRKIAARLQTPKRIVSKSTDGTDVNSGSEFELPIKTEKIKSPNSGGKIAGPDSSSSELSTNRQYKHLLSEINRMLSLECDKLSLTIESNHANLELTIRELDASFEETKEALLSYVRELRQYSHEGNSSSYAVEEQEEEEEEEEEGMETEDEDVNEDGGVEFPDTSQVRNRLSPISEESEESLSLATIAGGKAKLMATPHVSLSIGVMEPIGSRSAMNHGTARRRRTSSSAGATSSDSGTKTPQEGETGVTVISIQNSRAILGDLYRSFGEDFIPFRPPPDIMDQDEPDKPLRQWRDTTPDIAGALNLILAKYTPGLKIGSPHTRHSISGSSISKSPTPQREIGGSGEQSLGRSNYNLDVLNLKTGHTIGEEAVRDSKAGQKRGFDSVGTGTDASVRVKTATSTGARTSSPSMVPSSPPSSAKPGRRGAKGTRKSQRTEAAGGGVPVDALDGEGESEDRPSKKPRISTRSTRSAPVKSTPTKSTPAKSTPAKSTPAKTKARARAYSASVPTAEDDRRDHQTELESASKPKKGSKASAAASKFTVFRDAEAESPAKAKGKVKGKGKVKSKTKSPELEEDEDVYEIPASPEPEPDSTLVTRSGGARTTRGRGRTGTGSGRARGKRGRAKK